MLGMSSDFSNVRQHILDTARPIILGKGFTAVGLSEILTAANVPKGSFYHYFKSKDAFGVELLQQYFAGYLAAMDELLAGDGTAATRMMHYWNSWLVPTDCHERHSKCLVVKLGGEVCDLSEGMRDCLRHGTDAIIDRLSDCIVSGREDGSLADIENAHGTAEALYQMWLGAMLLSKIRRDSASLKVALSATRRLLGLPR